MKGLKKLAAVIAAISVAGTAGAAYAAVVKTPVEITAELTGKTAEQISNERASGETYGAIAKEAGKLEEFKAQMLEQKKAILDQRVEDGSLTQQEADEIYNTIRNTQENCDGTVILRLGQKNGAGFGNGTGMRKGKSGRMSGGTGIRKGFRGMN